MGEESFDNIADLMAAILARGISMQVKRGLSKDYISQVEITSSLRGKIDMTASIKGNTLRQKKLVCCFDEFSANERKNQIIKSTVQLLLQADILLLWIWWICIRYIGICGITGTIKPIKC